MSTCPVLFTPGDYSYLQRPFTISEIISYCCLAPLSLCSEILLLYFYSTRPYLRKSPGDLVLWQMLGQLVLDIGWLYSGYRYVATGHMLDNPACHAIAVTTIYAMVVVSGSNVLLAIEILVKLSRPFDEAAKHRKTVYLVVLHAAAMVITLLAACFGALSVTSSNKCFFFVVTYSYSVLAPYFPPRIATIGLFMVLELGLLLAMVYALTRLRKSTQLQKTILAKLVLFVLTSVLLEMAFPGYLVMQAVGYFVNLHYGNDRALHAQTYIGYVGTKWEVRYTQTTTLPIACASGLILSLLRLTDMSKLRISRQIEPRELGEISQEGSVNTLDHPQTIPFSYAALYSRVRNTTLKTTLLSLHLLYRLPQPLISPSNQHVRTWKLSGKHLKQVFEADEDFISRNEGFQATVTEHFPSDFERLRTERNVQMADLALSFCPIHNAATMEAHSGNNGGRSSAFIYFTFDRRFIIKTLSNSEMRFLERIIEEMMTYLLGKAGKASLLARILGVFSLSMRGMEDIHFAIIENIIPADSPIEVLFDLKGSQVHRAVVPADQPLTLSAKGKVLKDMDFLRLITALTLRPQSCDHFHSQIAHDTNFLRSIRSMDYSLLLGLSSCPEVLSPSRALLEADSEVVWYAGIIDYLQEYNVSKHIERVGKMLTNPVGKAEAHSCVNPDLYQERFCSFLRSIILS